MIRSIHSHSWLAHFACAIIGLASPALCLSEEAGNASPGQDVIVTAIPGVLNYDSETPPGDTQPIDAFSIGTICCNAGDTTIPLSEIDNQHFVLRQGMFRLKAGRFEQIGTSWVKHVYPASNEPGTCGLECTNPNVFGPELRPGCTDANSAGINGDRVRTTRAFEVNAFTGYFPYPSTSFYNEGTIAQRIQVHHSDLDPALNPGATYFVEAHYIHPGDAAAGNADNNATFARVMLSDPGTGTYTMTITSPALNRGQTKPAVLAWQDADASVTVTLVRVPNEGLFIVSAKATSIGGGMWHYEYAVENLNSDRAGQWFRIPFPTGARIQNVDFHDVDYHSGELQVGTNWAVNQINDTVVWSTENFSNNEHANALRWSTMYNFRFDANVGPSPTTAILGLFKPGTPSQVEFQTIGPALAFMDCNANDRLDTCDVNCAAATCPPPCGQSADCNANGLPDECETDCNNNGVPDSCDVGHSSSDCNTNAVPDECDPDCDEDGIPDECETTQDSDADGFSDCIDQCPLTTPLGACSPPEQVDCQISNNCFPLPRTLCLSQGGTPFCGEPGFCEGNPCPDSRCRDGCLPGDYDGDADRDLRDFAAFTRCYSAADPVGFSPTELCLSRFDLDNDSDLDLDDLSAHQSHWQNPF